MSKKKPLELVYNERGQPLCSRRKRQCECGHRYSKAEYPLTNCPDCGHMRQCESIVSAPGEACRFHGGRSLKGIASPKLKTGRWSKYLPTAGGLRDRYEESLRDERLAAVDDEIAVIDSRLAQLFERINTQDSGSSYFKRIRDSWAALSKAIKRQDAEGTAQAMADHDEAVKAGVADSLLWSDIGEWIERRRRLTETKAKQDQTARQNVSMNEFTLFYMTVLSVLKDEIKDRHTLGRLADKLDELYNGDQPALVEGRVIR